MNYIFIRERERIIGFYFCACMPKRKRKKMANVWFNNIDN